MSYTPTTWQTGDVVTSAKMNKIENGIADLDTTVSSIVESSSGGGGIFWITATSTEDYDELNKTWQEISDAIASGLLPVIKYIDDSVRTTICYIDSIAHTIGEEVVYTVEVFNNSGGSSVFSSGSATSTLKWYYESSPEDVA